MIEIFIIHFAITDVYHQKQLHAHRDKMVGLRWSQVVPISELNN